MVNVGIFSFIHFVKSNIKLKQNTEFKNLSFVNEAQMVFFLNDIIYDHNKSWHDFSRVILSKKKEAVSYFNIICEQIYVSN